MNKSQRLTLASVLVLEPSPQRRQPSVINDFASKVLYADDVESALQVIESAGVDLVVAAELFPASESLRLLGEMRSLGLDVPVVVVAERPVVELAVKFVRAGAFDYIAAPLDSESLSRLVTGMKSGSGSSSQHDRFFSCECPAGVPIVGKSEAINKSLEMIRLVAQSRCNPVLIMGDTGTGKELAAQAIHAWRCGDHDKLVAINCAALTSSLLESELFGHVKGAFTGADRDKAGLFELAGDGSLFLDEISEMPLELQAKLLRVLQERTFRKVGGTKDVHCNATIIASSNRNLFEDVGKGRFRRDLYYRLAIFPITMPRLASPQRMADIPLLAEYFVTTSNNPAAAHIKGISPQALQRLLAHTWPGNVRELRNVIERALILEKCDQITASSLLFENQEMPILPPQPPPAAPSPAARVKVNFSLETAEREFILRALQETGWQRTKAAALLGITRATLHAKLKRYDIHQPGGQELDQDDLDSPQLDQPQSVL